MLQLPVIFVFSLFLGLVMYANKFQKRKTKINLNKKLKVQVSVQVFQAETGNVTRNYCCAILFFQRPYQETTV